MLGPVAVSWAPPLPYGLVAMPNPARGQVIFRCAVAPPAPMTLRIYDPAGRLVRRLFAGAVAVGMEQAATWDGRSDGGVLVRRGRYFARLTWPAGAATAPLTILGPE